ncbi:hypothetical protein ACQPZX_29420 [Actinoplanes sp. CA-142083]|uniref:hypothetical protein n=1 Tax=Actinoplanes sp. CA-142083 TaxID=3239903 RepID=UPI003D928275
MSDVPNPYSDEEWQQRLAQAVGKTLHKKAAARDERRERQARRDAGLKQRHSTKLTQHDAATVVDESGSRCRYLVSEAPPRPCPNERLPGGEWCRPHLTRAVQLARRLGLDMEGERP